MKGSVVVRFREHIVVHRSGRAHCPPEDGPRYNGKEVRVLLPPRPATCHCGATYEWEMPDSEVVRLSGRSALPRRVVLCDRQIDVD